MLTLLGSAAQRINYYVVSSDVAARTVINSSEVTAISVPTDALPPTALTDSEVASGNYYSKIALKAGTVITSSVVTKGLDPLSKLLPSGYVMGSLTVSPGDAAGGQISSGDYVDIFAVNGSDSTATAKMVLQHVLVLNVITSPSSVATNANNSTGSSGTSSTTSSTTTNTNSSAAGPNSSSLYGGIPELYSFAVTPQDAATLALIRTSSVYLALTTATNPAPLDATAQGPSLFQPGAVGSSSPQTTSGGTTSSTGTTDTTTAVNTFYQKYNSAGDKFKVVNGELIAYTPSGSVDNQISLNGGSFDTNTGTYTSK